MKWYRITVTQRQFDIIAIVSIMILLAVVVKGCVQ
jgi:hypothetical protein